MSETEQMNQGRSTDGKSASNFNQINLGLLSRWVDSHFNTDEFYDLCRAMKIDHELFAGFNKTAKIREFLMYLSRYGLLDQLIEVGPKIQPEIEWSQWGGTATINKPNLPETAVPREEKQALRVDSTSIFSTFSLEYNFVQFSHFMQEAFTLNELLNFIDRIPEFEKFRLNLPADATHSYISRELLSFAQRHRKAILLLEQLEAARPELYLKHRPFIESGQLHVDVKLFIKGNIDQLKKLMAKQPGKAFDQEMLQAAENGIREI